MIITKQYIMDYRTAKGSWTKSQIQALGVEWPPKSGWIQLLEGKELSPEKAFIFEAKVPASIVRSKSLEAVSQAAQGLKFAELLVLRDMINGYLRGGL